MYVVTVFVIGICVVCAVPPKWHQLSTSYSFEQYSIDFHKSYSTDAERTYRSKIFAENFARVVRHNSEEHSWKMGVNHLADRNDAEIAGLRGGRYEPRYEAKFGSDYTPSLTVAPAESLDWRKHFPPVVTAVKDQGNCGDCWAHAVTEAIESSWAITTGQLFVLSQQQVTSCTPALGGCYSCNGSFPSLAFDYVVSEGITEEWIYPFESYNASFPQCRQDPFQNTSIPVNISGYLNVGPNRQSDLVAALNELGPIAILVDASGWSFYESGVFDGCSYAKNISMDHVVNVIGYGTDNNMDYWLVRNSWSPSWGENGFIRLAKPAVAECGWNVGAAHSDNCVSAGPPQTWSCGQCGILFAPQFPTVPPQL